MLIEQIKSPNIHTVPDPARCYHVFLAGSIDMGKAVDWQSRACSIMDSYPNNYVVYNPRRDDWDSSWDQVLGDNEFTRQVRWELQMLDEADIILMHITKESLAPITLLEFGRAAAMYPNKLALSVEHGFWRRGNIEVVCDLHNIPLYATLEEAMEAHVL